MDYLPIYICIYIPNCGEERREPTCVSDTHRPARMCRAVAVVSVSAEDASSRMRTHPLTRMRCNTPTASSPDRRPKRDGEC